MQSSARSEETFVATRGQRLELNALAGAIVSVDDLLPPVDV